MKEIILLSGIGIFSMIAEMLNLRKIILPAVILGLAAMVGLCFIDWNQNETVFGMLNFDHFALAFTGVFCSIALIWLLSTLDHWHHKSNYSDLISLACFAMVGGLILVSYSNLVMLFLGVEILSIPLYVLAGSNKSDTFSNESSFKYFLLGSFASGFLLFGITLLYGSTGSFDLAKIASFIHDNAHNMPQLMTIGVLLVIVGLAFKVSVVPFHFWAPDVYQGAPTPITAFMATIVKTVAFAGFFRLFYICFKQTGSMFADEFWSLSALTFMVANIIAAAQHSVKRMLAYSSISHAGFMLITLMSLNDRSGAVLLYYVGVYSVASIAAFMVLNKVSESHENREGIEIFDGLVKKNPLLAGTMTLSLLSMAGIPPLSGFFAKYFIFTQALQQHHIWLVVLAILGSVISIYYYFRVIIGMFFKNENHNAVYNLSLLHTILLIGTSAIIIFLGIYPDALMGIL